MVLLAETLRHLVKLLMRVVVARMDQLPRVVVPRQDLAEVGAEAQVQTSVVTVLLQRHILVDPQVQVAEQEGVENLVLQKPRLLVAMPPQILQPRI